MINVVKSKFDSLLNYFVKSKEEIKHIKYPTKQELYSRIIGVVVISSIASITFVISDFVIKWILSFFY